MALTAAERARAQQLAIELAYLDAQVETPSETRRLTLKLIRGVVLNVIGFAAAPPTGGLSAIACVIGFWDLAEALGDDLRNYNHQRAVRARIASIERQIADLESRR